MHFLNDSAAFTVAKSIKLGRDTSDSRLPGSKVPYSNTQPPKQKYECVKDADCAGVFICRSNKCIDPCTGVTCPGGQKCSVGKCVSCSRGESCGCSSPNVSNGSGACFDPCNPNYCASTTPTCSRSGANYSCACTSTSCGAGKKCSGSSCTNCAANESCNCPSGQKANGSGGCATVACSGNSDCGAGKQCANAGTISSYCYNCTANAQCTCPSGQLANGSGGCVKPVCYDNTPCGAGRQCIDGGKYNAKCDPCPSGTQCTCPSGQVADGSGGCGVNSCDGYLTANGYGAAKDMASFKAALASGVSEIGITASFTVNEDVNLNGKKIYPASKYTGSPKCSSTPEPTLEITGHVALANALIDGVNLNITGGSYKDYLVSGNGTLKDMDIATSYYAFMFKGNTVNLQGTINLSGSGINLDSGSSLNIAGTLSIAGSENSATIKLENSSKMTVASSGKFSYTGRAGTMGVVEASSGSKAIFNGPLVIKPVTGTNYQPGVWNGLKGYSGGSFELNANGNVIESYHAAIYISSSDTYTTSLKINGSTTLSMKNTGSTSGQHAIEAWGGNYGNKSKFTIDINAPLTVTGLHAYSGEYQTSQGDHLFYILDTTINVNSTVTTNTGIAMLLRNNLNMKAGGSILGLSRYSNEGSGTTTYTSGTKLKIGGVCKRATKTESKVGSSQTYYKIDVTSSNSLGSPFSGGC